MRRHEPHVYPHHEADMVREWAERCIPAEIREAMRRNGWNELGIYELVKGALAKARQEQRKERQ